MIIDRLTGVELLDGEYDDLFDYCRKPFCTRIRVTSDPVGESMTHQSFREETDINIIMDRFMRTGMLPPARKEAVYGDVTSMQGSLVDVINRSTDTIQRAEEFFDERDSKAKAEKAKADAEAEADRAAGKAARLAKGASKEKAPQGEAGGGSGGSAS